MKKIKRTLAMLLIAAIATTLCAIPAMAENLRGMTYTTPMDLQKYKISAEKKSPWVPFTGWSSDNGVLKGEDWIDYYYAAIVAVDSDNVEHYGEEAQNNKYYWHTPEKINVECTYDVGIYSVSDLDENGWISYFREESNEVYRDAEIASTNIEKHNDVDFFRIDFTFNSFEAIILYAPSESGDIFSFLYRYNPSTKINQKFEQDFWDVLDTVSLKQKNSSSPSPTETPQIQPTQKPQTQPAQKPQTPDDDDEELNWGGKTTIETDDMTITEYTGADAIKIYVNNKRIKPDTNPLIVNDRTMVPIRAVAEALGYSVKWFGESQTVSMQKGNDLIQLSIGSESLYHNTANIIIDVAPMIYEDRTYLPVRAVTEAMGCKVDWNGSENAVYITK